MKYETLNKYLDELNVDKNKILSDINSLPKRYHEEFIDEVLVDKYSILCFNKVYEYYITDIWNELNTEEKSNLDFLLIIELP